MIENFKLELVLNNNYHYYEFDNDKDFYIATEKLLNEGYVIKRHIFLALELEGKEKIILNPRHIDNPNDYENELNKLNPKHEIMMPDFNNSVLNIIAGIRKNFGFNYRNDVDSNLFDKKYDQTIILLLDGLGINVLEKNLPENSNLRTHLYKSASAIFPSTTAAATTSIKSGLTPLETGWTGWHNYIKEIDKDVVLFTGVEYYEKNKTGVSGYNIMPWKPFFHDMNMGRIVEPDFSKKIKLKGILKDSLKTIKNDKIQYVYYTEPDGLMHGFGTYSKECINELNKIDKMVNNYYKKLPQNTLLVVVADHGHIPVNGVDFCDNKMLCDMLERRPGNDTRCLTFKVKEGMKDTFKNLFNLFYGDIYDLYESDELVNRGIFGDTKYQKSERIKDFLADYTAIAKGEYILNTQHDDFVFKSHHAGLTKEEMLIPIIVFKK